MNQYIGVDIGGTKMYMLGEHDGKYIEKKVPTGFGVTKEFIKKEIDDFVMSLPFIPKVLGSLSQDLWKMPIQLFVQM